MSSSVDRRIHRVSRSGQASSVVEEVYGQIREAILGLEYPPATALNAAALADIYKVSTIPIREALRRLEAEGLVEIRPNKGAFAARVSREDIFDLFVARRIVEVGTLRLAMRSRKDYDLDLLARCLKEMEIHYSSGDRDAAYRSNRVFHLALLAPARSPRLNQVVENLFDAADRYLRMALAGSAAPSGIVDEHRAIFDAIRGGTAASAAAALDAHLAQSLDRVLSALPPSSPDQADSLPLAG